MKKVRAIVLALVLLILIGCIATAIAYPFIGRTEPPDVSNNDPGHGAGPGGEPLPDPDPEPNPDPDPEPDPDPDPEPDPGPDPNLIPRPKYVRGLYMTDGVFGWSAQKRDNIFRLIKEKNFNALVINIKNDSGQVTYKGTRVQLALEAGATVNNITSTDALFEIFRREQIYPIARIVVAKDPYVSKIRPEWFIQYRDDGELKTSHWADLRQEGYWEYLVDIAIEAAEMGFREIQFDYVRWPAGTDVKAPVSIPDYNLTNEGPYERTEAVAAFLSYAKDRLAPYDVEVSADIFGIVGTARHEETVGQQLEMVLDTGIDLICPMIYPGHYATAFYPPLPNRAPYEVVLKSAGDFLKRMEAVNTEVQMRPWLQAFTDSRDKGFIYGTKEIEDQIRALAELGVKEFLLWDAANVYSGVEGIEALE